MAQTVNEMIKLQVGVKILIKNNEGKFLLVHRSKKKYPNVERLWDIAGGRINPGTSLIDNLKREVKEETNLELSGEPTLVAAQDILKVQGNIVRLTYIGVANGEIKLDTEENDSYKWLTLDELKRLIGLDEYFQELVNHSSIL